MDKSLKKIHIGTLIKKRWQEMDISPERTCAFLNCEIEAVEAMFLQESIDTAMLLRWSKLLQYDFFRLYSHHLILYAPFGIPKKETKKTALPKFRKNIYTKEIIDFFLEMLRNKEKTATEIIETYRIPKTTLYKWISKYEEKNEKETAAPTTNESTKK